MKEDTFQFFTGKKFFIKVKHSISLNIKIKEWSI